MKYETNSNTRRTRRASAGAAGAPALRVNKIQMTQTGTINSKIVESYILNIRKL